MPSFTCLPLPSTLRVTEVTWYARRSPADDWLDARSKDMVTTQLPAAQTVGLIGDDKILNVPRPKQ